MGREEIDATGHPHDHVAASPVICIEEDLFRDFALPPVPIREKALLIVEELLTGLGRELEVRSLHDGIDRTGLLAQAAVDALHHVDVVTGCAPSSVVSTRSRLDRDRECRTNGLA